MTSRRQKHLIVRVTAQEFAALKQACESKGGRNLSDFARTELLSLAHLIEVAALKEKIAAVNEFLCGLEEQYNTLARRFQPVRMKALGAAGRSPQHQPCGG
jgi:hypothetical protein